jgi:hypothetical protein
MGMMPSELGQYPASEVEEMLDALELKLKYEAKQFKF